MMRVLMTGANGFLGRNLIRRLDGEGVCLNLIVRGESQKVRITKPMSGPLNHPASTKAQFYYAVDIGAATEWDDSLKGVDVVVHLAARAHVLHEKNADPLAAYRAVNTDGTLRLASASAAAGVRRFVFISSIGVLGNSDRGAPFSEGDLPRPHSDYAVAKWEAEQGLHALSRDTGMEIVIVRPPLVYGPEVQGNFLRLLSLVYRNWPLPFKDIKNSRSFIGVENLSEFLALCVHTKNAAGETFVLSDGRDFSTAELIIEIAARMNRRARLFPCPDALLRGFARFAGKESVYESLCGSLRVDNKKARSLLGWNPPLSAETGLTRTVEWFLASRHVR